MASYHDQVVEIGKLTRVEFLELEYKLLAEGKIIASIGLPSISTDIDAMVRMRQITVEIAALLSGPESEKIVATPKLDGHWDSSIQQSAIT